MAGFASFSVLIIASLLIRILHGEGSLFTFESRIDCVITSRTGHSIYLYTAIVAQLAALKTGLERIAALFRTRARQV